MFRKPELDFCTGKEFYLTELNKWYADCSFAEIARDILHRSKYKDVILCGFVRQPYNSVFSRPNKSAYGGSA